MKRITSEDPSASFFLGVDGGGSKTLAIVVDAQGYERGCGRAGSANYNAVGLQKAVDHVRTAIEAATNAAGCHFPLRAAWLGLAGIDGPGDGALLLPHLLPLAKEMRLTNDAELVLSALDGAVGVALIAGTGSIALGYDKCGATTRAGGWGHSLGDEGSGYEIGRLALQAAVRASDGRGKATTLLERIMNYWQLNTVNDLTSQVYLYGSTTKIAALSMLVFTAAKEGDALAQEIVQRAVDELALAAVTVSKKLDFTAMPIPLALGGGLLIHEHDFRTQIVERIRQSLPVGKVVLVEHPAYSAACAAMRLSL
ncbi:MAG TPA: BadF/BadG/BcrA/BcrD ATPase family protein [Ktedonobacteraceae bacterium]|nr:BadF/BadG/BcrA/BcrD ATPase family protein [Ktedonobacteraceae bacterium]